MKWMNEKTIHVKQSKAAYFRKNILGPLDQILDPLPTTTNTQF